MGKLRIKTASQRYIRINLKPAVKLQLVKYIIIDVTAQKVIDKIGGNNFLKKDIKIM